jgi:hypothetical protein
MTDLLFIFYYFFRTLSNLKLYFIYDQLIFNRNNNYNILIIKTYIIRILISLKVKYSHHYKKFK